MNPVARYFLLLALMVASSGASIAMKPTKKIADHAAPVKLEAMIPKQFGDWKEEPQNQSFIIDPQQLETINRIYTQTLSRTYINANGYRIMLSIAYGNDQSDAKQAHKPEVCYPSQGFQLKGKHSELLQTIWGNIPVTRLQTQLGQRHEPLTYWITVGNKVVQGGLDKKISEMKYGLRGEIPDGLLFRVSSIDKDVSGAFRSQDEFVSQLLKGMDKEAALKVFGDSIDL